MANFEQLKATVANVIKTNGEENITGAIMQDVLLTIINSIAGGYMFGGVAQHSGNVGNPDYNVFYLAGSGAYTGYGGAITIPDGCYGVFLYNGTWLQEVVDIGVHLTGDVATGEQDGVTGGRIKQALDDLEDNINTAINELASAIRQTFESLLVSDVTAVADKLVKITEGIRITVGGQIVNISTFDILAATAEKAGLMSAADKQMLDGLFDKIRTLSISETTPQGEEGVKIVESLSATLGDTAEVISTFTILAATASKAGLMSADDKTALDTLPSLINAGYLYAGIATPSTVPSSTSAKIYYIAIEGGTYTSFGDLNVTQGINIIYKSGNAWIVAQAIGIDDEPTAGSGNLVKGSGISNMYGYYEDSVEYIKIVLDKKGRILYGVKRDGDFVWGAGVPSVIKDYCAGNVNGKSLINRDYADEVSYEDASEFLSVVLDRNNKIIEAVRTDGTKVLPAGTDIDGNLTKSVLNPEFIQVTVDNKGKILDYLKKDGTRYFQKLSSPEIELLNEKVDDIAGASKKNLFHYDATPDGVSYILSPFNDDYYIKTYFNVRREEEAFTHNSCFNFNSVALVNKDTLSEVTVDSCADDIAPGKWNSGYIGANHGLDDMKRCTCVGHDKTYADIGSVWSCNGDNFTIVGVAPNYLYLLGENILAYPLFMMATVPSSGEFVHVSGATHTNSFTTTAAVMNQMWNQTRPVSLNISADGKPVTESGDYKFNILDICEVYDVINQADSLAEIKRRVGTFTANPIFTKLANVNSAARHSTTYSFNNAGSWRIAVDYTAIQNIVLDYFGFTQMAVLPGDNIKLYIPKALPISNGEETIDFRTIAPHNNVPATMNLTSEYWENPQLPPDRWLEYSENIGVASGYLFDYGVGGENRKDNINNAFFLYTSRKVYPHGIDSKISLQGGESKSAVVFRSYMDVSVIDKNGIILANTVEYNGALYLYADFNAAGMYNIEIPADYCGKKIDLFEKSSNVDLISSMSSGCILVKVTSSNPMYGYLVAKIK